ncbi:MAG: ABC transporter permease [Hyphomicrobiaceae bacterium]
MTFVALSYWDLSLAAALILINAALSWVFSLGLGRTLAVAAIRMIVQLSLIGLVLTWIFQQTSPLWTLALALVMIAVAGFEAISRQRRRFQGFMAYGLGAGTLFFVGLIVTIYAVAGIISPEPWYQARYVLPILGMILGNALTGVSLVLNTLTETANRERVAIEAQLALGATRFQALRNVLQLALRTGLIPIVNAMAASGLVSLPGMMTGQILAGMNPVDAAKYQIMIMFVIAGATALSVTLAGVGGVLLLTDSRDRLRLDRLSANPTS